MIRSSVAWNFGATSDQMELVVLMEWKKKWKKLIGQT